MTSHRPEHREPATTGTRRSAWSRSADDRERLAERIADRLDVPVTVGGVIFLLLVLAETISQPGGTVSTVYTWLGWALWALFVAEFVARLIVAPSTAGYLKRNWWQVLFLAVPALRFVRAIRVLRAARLGRVLSSAVRSGRSAGQRLSSRLLSLGAVTCVVVLGGSQILYELGAFSSYADALYATTLATIAGEPLSPTSPFARAVDVLLVSYSVVVFATLAGSAGAFILERRDDDRVRMRRGGPSPAEAIDQRPHDS